LDALLDILGPEFVRPAAHGDISWEQGRPDWIAWPGTEREVALCLNAAREAGIHVFPSGSGTKLHWGNPAPPTGVLLSLQRLNRVLEHAAGDMTVTVEAGCTVAALQQAVAKAGQRLAADPLWPDRATVGGVIATNDNGPLRAGFGSLRDLILGVTVALADSTLAASGGKVVKNVAGYDLPKLMVGAFGTLGVVTRATFRLHPLPKATRTLRFAATDAEHAQILLLAMLGSTTPVTGLQVLGGNSGPWCVAVRLEGSVHGVHAMAEPVAELAARHRLAPTTDPPDPWAEREGMWQEYGSAIAKTTFVPSQLAAVCREIDAPRWRLVAQGAGVALVTLSDAYDEQGLERMELLAQKLRRIGASLIILRGTPELKRRVNPLQDMSALPLMKRIKQQFDPSGTLNPGRIGGGI
jgi:glycolate oxidase FAD binding subunit